MRLLSTSFLLFGFYFVFGQWTNHSNGIYYNSGRVGIGITPTSSHSLLIYGSNSQNLLKVQNNRVSDAGIEFQTTLARYKIGSGIGSATNQFTIYDLNAGKARFVINGNGNVGINAPVYNDTRVNVENVASGNRIAVWGYAESTNSGDSYGVVGSARGSGDVVGVYGWALDGGYWAGFFNGHLGYTGNFVDTSDERLKENIEEINDGLDKVLQLSPKNYYMKRDPIMNFGGRKEFGFIAQEVKNILPELVFENVLINPPSRENELPKSNENYLGIDYVKIIPYLVAAIKEQQNMIENQGNIIGSLIGNIDNPETNVILPSVEKIYPNPGQNVILVNVINTGNRVLDLQLFSFNGVELISSHSIDLQTSIDVSGLNNGYYFLTLSEGGIIYETHKIQIMH